MLEKINKSLGQESLTGLIAIGLYLFTSIPCAADDFARNCKYGLYPTKDYPHRFCSPVGDHRDNCWFCNEERRCYLTVQDLAGGPVNFWGITLWELFYDSSGNGMENCYKWRDACPNCDPDGKPVTQLKKEAKNIPEKKPDQP